jgi:hypothetical protein
MDRLMMRMSFKRIVAFLVVLTLAFPLAVSFVTPSTVSASNWAGWSDINEIYFDTSQDDATNHFLEKAALELQNYLGQMAGRSFTITNSYPSSPAIYLNVDAAMLAGHSEEASRLVLYDNGVTITGKTAFAVRSGAYRLLDRLGVKWLMKGDIWTVVPSSLTDPNGLDVIEEPDYVYREIEYGPNPLYDRSLSEEWRIRNLCGGPRMYRISHTYNMFMPAELYSNYPDAYLPEGVAPASGSTTGWQLKPDNPDVISHAEAWAQQQAAGSEGSWTANTYTQEDIPGAAIPMSPNDGQSWGTYDDYGSQVLTDKIYGLVNTVAESIYTSYPDILVGCYNYSEYSEVPSFDFTYPNVYVEVATAYDYTDLTDLERIAGLKALGATVGMREYFDPTQWYHDLPPSDWAAKKLSEIKTFYDAGATVYRSEGCESWGSAGFVYWIAARLAWDTNQSVGDLLDEFCTYAFGPAKEPMKRYYQMWLDGQHITDNSLSAAVADFVEAESLANGDEAILNRIRYEEYYIYYEWKYRTINDLDLNGLANLWSWTTKLQDLYVLAFRYIVDDVFHDRLRDNFGMSEEQITTWMNTYADYTPPTAQEAATWLAELQAEFSGVTPIHGNYVDPYDLNLRALGDTSMPSGDPIIGTYQSVLVLAEANDTVNTSLQAGTSFDDTWFFWKDPSLNVISSTLIPKPRNWTSQDFIASAGDGIYTIDGDNEYPYGGGINVLSHPAGMTSGGRLRECDAYFYVPEGIEGFFFELEPGHNTTTIYDPHGNAYASITGPTIDYEVLGANNPETGLWRIHYCPDANSHITYKLFGIPDLIWHNPEYLLVEDTASPTPQPPVLRPIGNKTAYVNLLFQFTVSATDPNFDALTYSASNLPPWATFNAATRTLSGTPNQVGTYTNVYFEVSDGTWTDGEYITITVTLPGGSPDINRDGIVNIFDMISVMQHWGESGSNGWIYQDANSDGRIDVLDIIVIGQYWTS